MCSEVDRFIARVRSQRTWHSLSYLAISRAFSTRPLLKRSRSIPTIFLDCKNAYALVPHACQFDPVKLKYTNQGHRNLGCLWSIRVFGHDWQSQPLRGSSPKAHVLGVYNFTDNWIPFPLDPVIPPIPLSNSDPFRKSHTNKHAQSVVRGSQETIVL